MSQLTYFIVQADLSKSVILLSLDAVKSNRSRACSYYLDGIVVALLLA